MRDESFDRTIRQKLAAHACAYHAADWSHLEAQLRVAFDRTIASKLATHRLSYSPEAWKAFEQALIHHFDQQVYQVLSTHELPYEPAAWAELAHRLEGDALLQAIASKLAFFELVFEPADWTTLSQQLDAHPLDTQLREQLDQYQATAPAEAWEAFEAFRESTFDQQLREKLLKADLADPATDWADMAAALDSHPLDTQLRAQLETHQVAYLSADWEDLSARLNAPFDALVRQKLGGHQLPYARGAWRQFAQAAPINVRPWRQWRNYAAAAAVVLLLLFNFGSWLWQEGRLSRLTKPLTSRNQPPAVAPADTTPISPADPTFAAVSPPAPASTAPDIQLAPPKAADPVTLAAVIPLAEGATPSEIWQEDALHKPLPTFPATGKQPDEAVALADPHAESPEIRLLSGLQPLGKNPFGLSPCLHKRGTHKLEAFNEARGPNLRLGLIGATSSTRAELNGANSEPGYTAGIRLEMLLDNSWTFVTGLQYGFNRFNHEYTIFASNGRTYRNAIDAELTLVQAPLIMRYTFPSSTNLSLYFQAGIVPMLSLQENYRIYDPNDPANQGIRTTDLRTALQPRDQARSLNTYVGNIHGGTGLEYSISDRLAVQVEPYFLLWLQRTQGSGSLGLEKQLYTSGVGFSLLYNLSPAQSL